MSVVDLLKSNKAQLQKLWNDKATISRYVTGTKPNGAVGLILKPIYPDIACHLSQKPTTATQTESTNDIAYTQTLFYDTNVHVLAGDVVQVTVKDTGIAHTFVATEEIQRYSHNSVELKKEAKA